MICYIVGYAAAAAALVLNFFGPKIIARVRGVDRLGQNQINAVKLTALGIAVIGLIFVFIFR